jgi:hypothetical protein
MASEQYELTGSAVYGVEPHLMDRGLVAAALDGQPEAVKVCMGARLDDAPVPAAVPRLADFFRPAARLALPASTNRRAKAAKSLATMLGNDRQGCCTVSSTGHQTGVCSANDSDSPGEVVMTTQEALATYHRIGGPGDNGLVIRDVLEHWRTVGIPMGGTVHKIDGYAAIDWRDHDLMRGAVQVFGGIKIGFRCPPQFLQSKDWSYVGPPVTRGRGAWGGHDAPAIDYTEQGPLSSSWGRVYQWDQRAWGAYVTEAWVVLMPEWYNADGLAASGFDVAGLRAAMDAMSKGRLPDDPKPAPPSPPPPPGPPLPPAASYLLNGTFTGEFKPVPQPDAVTIDCPHELHGRRAIAAVREAFGHDLGFRWAGGKLTGSRPGKLSPQQWANLLADLIKLLTLIAEIAPLFA